MSPDTKPTVGPPLLGRQWKVGIDGCGSSFISERLIMPKDKSTKSKPKTLSYAQRARLEELEGKLFGRTAGLRGFGQEAEQNAVSLPTQSQQEKGKALEGETPFIIWEDRRATAVQASDTEGTSEEEEEEAREEHLALELGASADSELRESPSTDETDSPQRHKARVPEPGEDTVDEGGKSGEAEHEVLAVERDASSDDDTRERQASSRLATVPGRRRPAWEDPDEEGLQVDIAGVNRLRKLRQVDTDKILTGREYSIRLKKQHAKLHPRTSWASLDKGRKKRKRGDEEGEEDEEGPLERLQQGAGDLLAGSAILPAGLLETTRVKDANHQEPNNAVVQSVEFHPSGQLLLTAGLDKRLRFFQVDGVKNAKVQSVFLEDMPIHKAAFAQGGSKVIASGRRKHFYVFDLEAAHVERVSHLTNRAEKSLENFAVTPAHGKPLIAFLGAQGYIPLVSLESCQVVGQLKMAGSVRSAVFSSDGTQLMASGGDGVVHTWDMRTRRCISRFIDEGALKGISLASSPGDRLLAAGSDAGFVNIYRQRGAVQAGIINLDEPTAAAVVKPYKTFTNLTTAIDNLTFSPDGQILAMASRWKPDALRLVHTGSMTVFSNWPTSRTPINYVHSMAFSPHGGFFAVGNAKGRVLMYRIHHYSQA